MVTTARNLVRTNSPVCLVGWLGSEPTTYAFLPWAFPAQSGQRPKSCSGLVIRDFQSAAQPTSNFTAYKSMTYQRGCFFSTKT